MCSKQQPTVQYATRLPLYCLTIFVLHLACSEQDQIAFLYAVTACPTQLSATADVLLFKTATFCQKRLKSLTQCLILYSTGYTVEVVKSGRIIQNTLGRAAVIIFITRVKL